MPTGTCPLCERTDQPLQISHYMSGALYNPRHKRPEYVTRAGSFPVRKDIKARLLCRDCETTLNKGGESYVLNLIATKSRSFPLGEKLWLALPREVLDRSISRFSGQDLGVDMDKFAYFAISVVWRGAVGQWNGADGTPLPQFALGGFEPPMREYLLGKTHLSPNTTVIVIVASDRESRRTWFVPVCEVLDNCLNFRFLARGVFFRVMMGHVPQYFRDYCCTSPRKCIFYGDGEHRTLEALGKPGQDRLIIP